MKPKFTDLPMQLLFAALLCFGLSSSAYAQTYCNSSFSNVNYEFVTNVTFEGINNPTGGNTGGPVDYTGLTPAEVTQGTSYMLSVTIDADASDYVYAFIDWNQNGTLDDPGEAYTLASSTSSNGPFTLSIAVPVGAQVGNTRMRVMVDWNNANPDPCRNAMYGEAEDYTVNVNALVSCSAQPTAGAVPDTLYVCPSDPLSLTAAGSTLAGSMSNQWQSSPAGANTWSDIAGAVNASYTIAGGVTVPTDFRYIALCTVSSLSDTSNTMTVMINPPGQCYCTPSATNINYYIDDFSTTGGTTNITNNSTGFSSNGYADYTNDTVSAIQGSSVFISSDFSSYSNWGARIWIDWNQNGTFSDPGEEIFATNTYVYSLSNISVTVPLSATPGNTRMRIRVSYTPSGGPDACTSPGNFGEAEDYTFHVIQLPGCSGQPSAGTVADTLGICPSIAFDLSANNATSGLSGLTNQWQSSPAGANTWSDIAGANSAVYHLSTGITATTDYRYITTCDSSGLSDTSAVLTAVLNPPNQCYCIPTNTYSSSYYISSFSTTGGVINITNNNTGFSATGYGDYHLTDTVSAMASTLIHISAAHPSSTYEYGIWVDWNQDGDFDDAGEDVLSSGGYVSAPYTGSFTVPLTALPGATRLRVRNAYLSQPAPACGSFNYGEAEDYTFYVIPPPLCDTSVLPVSVIAFADMDTLCVTGDITMDLDTTLLLSGLTYQWQKASSAAGPWSDIDSAQDFPPKSITDVDTTTWFRCQVLCSGSPAITSNTIQVQVNNPQLTGAPADGSRCGPGSVTLSATAAAGNTINWYDAAAGGLPVGTGPIFNTPNISSTTDYYVAASAGGNATPGSLDALSGGTNGCGGGVMFDIIPSVNLNIDSFAALTDGSGTAVNVYYRNGTYSGNGTNSSAWTLAATVNINYTTGQTISIPLPSSLNLTAGNTYGIYLNYYSGYTTGDGSNQTFSNSEMTLNAGYGLCSDFGGLNDPRVFNGTVFYHQSGCESPRQTVTATIDPLPVINLGSDTVVCDPNATITLDAANPGSSYAWNTLASSQTITVSAPGVYSVSVTGTNSCIATDSIELIQGIIPQDNLPDSVELCSGSSVTLDAGNPGSTYSWNGAQTSQALTVSTAGNYSVAVTSLSGCVLSVSTEVVEIPLPLVSLGADTILCPGSSLTLNAGGGPGSSYAWNSNATTPSINVSGAGTYTVTVTGSNGCVNADTIEIMTGVFPQNTLPGILNLCEGDTAVLNAGNTGSAYIWSTNETTQTIEVSTAGNYSVAITNEMACVLNTTTEVILRPLPLIDLGPDTTICIGTAITLDAENTGSNFNWNTGAVTQTISASDSGNYSVTVTSPYNCVSSEAIQVSTLPGASVSGFNFIPLFYEDLGKVKFHANEPEGVLNYHWDFGDGSSSDEAEPEHIYAATGDYLVTLAVSNDCGSQSSVLLVHVDLTVGIVSVEDAGMHLLLYPNPARELIIIESKSPGVRIQQVSIYNQLGARVYHRSPLKGLLRQEISVSNLAAGVYSVIIRTDNDETMFRKFEVIH